MSACKINIGHDRKHVGKQPLTDERVEYVLEAESAYWPVQVVNPQHWQGASEKTTVCGLVCEDEQTLRNFIEELCEHLEQECISVLWGPVWTPPYRGEFIGPEAKKWQDKYGWQAKEFINTNGQPLE